MLVDIHSAAKQILHFASDVAILSKKYHRATENFAISFPGLRSLASSTSCTIKKGLEL